MSGWKLVKLNFGRSPAHFGELGIGLEETSERVCSDTLFSAWVSIYARLFGKDGVEELLQRFPSDKQPQSLPPFQISSTFIYRQIGDKTVYYLPRPLQFPINYPADDRGDKGDLKFFKTYKKLNYLPLEVWQKWYQREGFTKGDRQELIAETEDKSYGHLQAAGTFDYTKAFKTQQLPKISVDRITRATNLYHIGFVQFEWEENRSGLYFLVYFPEGDSQLEHDLQAALHLLGEEGIGGERSSGAGRFEIEWLLLPEPWQKVVDFDSGSHYSLISLFWESPLSDEFLKNASYEIQERGGWIAESQQRRKMVRMFAEGSVFLNKPQGRLVDVTPKDFNRHRVYRSGVSLSLPIQCKLGN